MKEPQFPQPEITAEAVEALRDLEFLKRTGQAEVLLVAGGLKPATEQRMLYMHGSRAYTIDDFNRDVQRFRGALDMLHLSYVAKPGEDMEGKWMTFWIAPDPATSERLAESVSWDDAHRIPERGKMLGLPQTAIDAFPNAIMDKHQLPEEVRDSRGYKLMEFMPSRDHWRDELAVLEERAAFVDQVAPGLLDDEPVDTQKGQG
jgi:hypothetical protein